MRFIYREIKMSRPWPWQKNAKPNKVIHSRTILLNFQVEDIPRVPNLEKIHTAKLGGGFHRVRVCYGFMENLTLESVPALMRGQGLDLNPQTARFYIGRENLVVAEASAMARWRANLFNIMSRKGGHIWPPVIYDPD
jgi:KUP system potassium uptake protein